MWDLWKDVRRQSEKASTLTDEIDKRKVDADIQASGRYKNLVNSKERLRNITRRRMPLLFGPHKRDTFLEGVEKEINVLDEYIKLKNTTEGPAFIKWLEESIDQVQTAYFKKFERNYARADVEHLFENILCTEDRINEFIKKLNSSGREEEIDDYLKHLSPCPAIKPVGGTRRKRRRKRARPSRK